MKDADGLKRAAALGAVELVESGMLVGLGSGSTARHAVVEIAARLRDGRLRDLRGVPTSAATEGLAREEGIPLVELPAEGVDLAIDGMDEVDGRLRAVKGLGGALAREKVVAASAARFVLIGDEGKRVERLGSKAPIPVEVLPFGLRRTARLLEGLGLEPELRLQGRDPYLTDNGNPVLDCRSVGAFVPEELAASLDATPGVVEHGLFVAMASLAFIAGDGGVEVLEQPR